MKQFIKFGHEHTCNCKVIKADLNTNEVIGCDFKNKTKEGFKGYLWYKCKCKNCGGFILHGMSYADFRVKREGLLLSAIQSAANDFSYQTFNTLAKQFYNGKHFQSRFIIQ